MGYELRVLEDACVPEVGELGRLPVIECFEIRGVLLVGVVEGWWALVLESVAVDHLMVDHFEEDHDVGHHGSCHPDPQQTFLTEMLGVEGFRLEVQVLALVIPLVGNIVPEDLAVWLDEVSLGDAESVSAANVIDGEVFGIVLCGEGGDGGFGGGLEWLRILVGVGDAEGAWILLEVGV